MTGVQLIFEHVGQFMCYHLSHIAHVSSQWMDIRLCAAYRCLAPLTVVYMRVCMYEAYHINVLALTWTPKRTILLILVLDAVKHHANMSLVVLRIVFFVNMI